MKDVIFSLRELEKKLYPEWTASWKVDNVPGEDNRFYWVSFFSMSSNIELIIDLNLDGSIQGIELWNDNDIPYWNITSILEQKDLNSAFKEWIIFNIDLFI